MKIEDQAMLRSMVEKLRGHGVERVHVLAWRDLDDPEAGGSEIHADAFMSRWQEAGLTIVHRTSAALGQPSHSQRYGYEVVRRGGRMTVFPRTALAELFGRMGPYDALVEIWNGVPWLSPLWCRRPRLLIYHHVHGPMWNQIFPRPFAALGRLVETRLAPPCYRSTPTVTLSRDSYDEMVTHGWRSENISIAPAGVDPMFSPGGERSSTPTVLAVGRLAPVKRFEILIDQFCLTRQMIPHATLTIVGDGPLRKQLEARIAAQGARDWIFLVGRVSAEELLRLYRSSWVISSASLTEGWGLTLTEAAGCGTPAVVSDVPGHRSSVLRDRTGRLVPIGELGRTLAALLADDSERLNMGQAAEEWARTLSWDRLACQVLEPLVSEVVKRSTLPDSR